MNLFRRRNSELEAPISQSEPRIPEAEPVISEAEPVNPEIARIDEYRQWFFRSRFSACRLVSFLGYAFFVIVAVLTGLGIVIEKPGWEIVSIDFHSMEFFTVIYASVLYFFVEFFYHLICFTKRKVFTPNKVRTFRIWRRCLFFVASAEILFCMYVLQHYIFPGPEEHNCSTFNETCLHTLVKLFWIPVCHGWSIALFSGWMTQYENSVAILAGAEVEIAAEAFYDSEF